MLNKGVSSRLRQLHSSPIRDILSIIDQPSMVSFAGGLPSVDSFPALDIGRMPVAMMQYGASEGEPALREQIAQELQSLGLVLEAQQVLVVSGSQQGIDLVAKLFIDSGTPVALESPSYLAALQVFRFYGMKAVSLNPDEPQVALTQAGSKPAFAYVIPTFQNPTGRCWSARQREGLAALADDTGTVIFEDDPYRDLVYEAVERTPICAQLKQASWVYQGSFSKSLAPGLRVGYLAASPDLMPWLVRLKQAADLHTSRISQWLVLEHLRESNRAIRMRGLVAGYRAKRDVFQQALIRHFSDIATWEQPSGGLFFWLRLNRDIDTASLLSESIENNIAFMPGEPFFAEGTLPYPALRLNFSHAEESDVDAALATLAVLIRRRGGGV